MVVLYDTPAKCKSTLVALPPFAGPGVKTARMGFLGIARIAPAYQKAECEAFYALLPNVTSLFRREVNDVRDLLIRKIFIFPQQYNFAKFNSQLLDGRSHPICLQLAHINIV
jgi:hypothetical protein